MKRRLGHAVLALLAAWAVGTLATVPFQVAVCLRNSDGDMRLFMQVLPLGLMIWAVWTLGLALGGWLVLALPFALLVDAQWIHRRLPWLIAACAVLSLAATSNQFQIWKLLYWNEPVDKHSFWVYTVFTLSYSVTMTVVYSWLAGRALRPPVTSAPERG